MFLTKNYQERQPRIRKSYLISRQIDSSEHTQSQSRHGQIALWRLNPFGVQEMSTGDDHR